MKRTDYLVIVAKEGKYGVDVYRTVFTDGKDYFIKWHGKIINVNDEVYGGYIRYKWTI